MGIRKVRNIRVLFNILTVSETGSEKKETGSVKNENDEKNEG
jgi:alcohol dehydrogenase YqhD (iron-dependent ADH family)